MFLTVKRALKRSAWIRDYVADGRPLHVLKTDVCRQLHRLTGEIVAAVDLCGKRFEVAYRGDIIGILAGKVNKFLADQAGLAGLEVFVGPVRHDLAVVVRGFHGLGIAAFALAGVPVICGISDRPCIGKIMTKRGNGLAAGENHAAVRALCTGSRTGGHAGGIAGSVVPPTWVAFPTASVLVSVQFPRLHLYLLIVVPHFSSVPSSTQLCPSASASFSPQTVQN